jgi:hypothetical protein
MTITDLVEKIWDETNCGSVCLNSLGTGLAADTLPAMVELKDGTCLQIREVEMRNDGLYIQVENW